jgi:hypothetical protein
MTAWDDVLDRVEVHLQTAGATLRRPVTDVRLGEPAVFSAPLAAYWYIGDSEGRLIGNTLSKASYTELLRLRWYWPVGDRAINAAADVERELRQANRATTNALWADTTLGGACAGLSFPEDTESGWIEAVSGWVRTVTITVGIEMVDLADIST